MKLNRIIALAVIALTVLAIGTIGVRVLAQPQTPTVSPRVSQDSEIKETPETQKSAPDHDNVEVKEGDQNEANDLEETGAEIEGSSEAGDPVPQGTPAITSDAAQKTAEAYLNVSPALKVTLDDENGKLIYSVEFANGTDVKVDAMSSAVLGAETSEE